HEKVGEAVARHLLGKGHRHRGLVTADDERALARRRGFLNELARTRDAHAALEETRARKLAVPGSLAIMGFGGLEFTEHTFPALSSVTVDRAGIGRRAAEEILARFEGDAKPGKVIDVGFV